MKKLKELLLEEQAKLEKYVRVTEKRLKNAPEGSLKMSKSNKCVQFYHYLPYQAPEVGSKEATDEEKMKENNDINNDTIDDNNNDINNDIKNENSNNNNNYKRLTGHGNNLRYIKKENFELVRALAQKCYDLRVYKLAKKRLGQIKVITKDYENNEIERLFLKENTERRKLISPVAPSYEQQVKAWMEQEFSGKGFMPGTVEIYAKNGIRVRSKSEKFLADYFYDMGIPFLYEKPLELVGYGTVYPDFTFISTKTGKEVYWEHEGRMDDTEYASKAVKKINLYIKNNILPGDRLILTYETAYTVLDMKIVEKFVELYL